MQSSSAAPEDALLRRVWAIMNTGVVSHVLSYVEKGETIPIDEIGYSYATYMLFSLAMIFDIENEVARLTVQHDHLLDTRLSFLQPRLNEQEFEHLKISLERAYQ